MDREEMRKAFEEWATLPEVQLSTERNPKITTTYRDFPTAFAWAGWQAAMAHSCTYRPVKFTPDEVEFGSAAIRWVTAEGVGGRPTLHDVLNYIERRGEDIVCTCERCKSFTLSRHGG